MASPSVNVASAADQVYAILRERILAGQLDEQARLHQEALSRELGVSRTPVREALARLASDGLVELLPNRGARIAGITHADMAAAYQARVAVEPAAAGLAAERATPEDVARLRAAAGANASAAGRVPDAYATNRAFHLELVRAGGNPFLLRFAESLWVAGIGLRVYDMQRSLADVVAVDTAQHSEIVEAVAAGDAERAERLTRRHVAGAMALLLERLAADAA